MRAGGTLLTCLVICLALLGLLGLASLAIGSRSLTPGEAWSGLMGHGQQTVSSVIVWRLRMPRTILAIVVGACLAVAGVVMQALTRNPLAEPGILGVNAGASLAVVLSIALLGVTDVHGYLWFAFAGAALAAVLVHLMARRSADAGPARLVLAGVALGASLHAITGAITMYGTRAFDSYRFWVVGSLEERDASLLAWVWPFLAVGLLLAASLVAGPVLLLAADIAGRLLIRPDEMEAGVVTAFIGGPVLLAMVVRRQEAGTP